jgi:hypothetical protein
VSGTWADGGDYAEEAIARVRQRLRAFTAARSWSAAPPWAFVLYCRDHPRPGLLLPRIIGVITLGDSFPLTHGLISRLGQRLWIEGGCDAAEIIPLCADELLLAEPAAGVLLRIWARGEPAADTVALSARDLPPDGLLLMSDQPGPPYGWPR